VLRWGLPLLIVGWIVTVTGGFLGFVWLVAPSSGVAFAAAVLMTAGFLVAAAGSVALSCYRARPITDDSPHPGQPSMKPK
jgi:hypothetical protein